MQLKRNSDAHMHAESEATALILMWVIYRPTVGGLSSRSGGVTVEHTLCLWSFRVVNVVACIYMHHYLSPRTQRGKAIHCKSRYRFRLVEICVRIVYNPLQ